MSDNKSPCPVGVIGGSGYAGRELLTILRSHPGADVRFATARTEVGAESPLPGLPFVDPDAAALSSVEILFLCLPHGSAAPWVERARAAGVRVVDLTADHRPGSGREAGAVYGLTELRGGLLETADLVANPGCYPTGVILALEPLRRAGLVDEARPVVVSAASGVTGAGRSPRRELLFAEVAGDYRPYAMGNRHRHLLEIRAALPGIQIVFAPHLLPVPRGILETVFLPVREGVDSGAVRSAWSQAYGDSPVVRWNGAVPSLSDVVGTDRLHLGVSDNEATDPALLTLVIALDNLGKGAAGQAVQNMNLMLGLPPEAGLRC